MSTVQDKGSARAQEYYDSNDADNFYYAVWGGEDIHVGLYHSETEDIRTASARTVAHMADLLAPLPEDVHLLDIGAGYGGAARHLFKLLAPTKITCLNISEVQNERNKAFNREAGLESRIDVLGGSFEDIPLAGNSVQVVWCQDSILHSGSKWQVFQEVDRVLQPGGMFIFTDPMQGDNTDPAEIPEVLQRIHLEEMGSFKRYREFAQQLGWEELSIVRLSDQLTRHYGRVRQELNSRREELVGKCSEAYMERMLSGLDKWVAAGKADKLAWGILQFRKPH